MFDLFELFAKHEVFLEIASSKKILDIQQFVHEQQLVESENIEKVCLTV